MATDRKVDVQLCKTGQPIVQAARWCDSWLCKLRGLQFRRSLKPGEGLILVGGSDSTTGSSIHMLFVFFPIGVVWINSEGYVTHTVLARPWRLFYGSKEPARYVLEGEPALLEAVKPGDKIRFQFLDEQAANM